MNAINAPALLILGGILYAYIIVLILVWPEDSNEK